MISTGNHAITSLPLLSGAFWDFQPPAEDLRGDVMRLEMVCANCVGDTFELSQREVPTAGLVDMDEWLQGLGCPMSKIVVVDRVNETLEHYRRRGQEWRSSQAWTLDNGERCAAASAACTPIRYYHNVKGVHFLSLPNLLDWGAKIEADYPEFLRGLAELAATTPEAPEGNLLLEKYHGHHEIEFFGAMPGVAIRQIVPLVHDLHAYTRKTKCSAKDARALRRHRADLPQRPGAPTSATARWRSRDSRNITGEIPPTSTTHVRLRRHAQGFPARLRQAARRQGILAPRGRRRRAAVSPIADAPSQASTAPSPSSTPSGRREPRRPHRDRRVYGSTASNDRAFAGDGKTREVVYKTEWNPLPIRVIEKRLALKSTGYGAYTIARTHAFRALGIAFGQHRMLARQDGSAGAVHYFTRMRYPGEPFIALPPRASATATP